MSGTRTKAQQEEIQTAMQAVRVIDALAVNDDFRQFMTRFTRRADELAEMILHDDKLKPKQREKLRNRRLGLLEILLAPKEDRAAQVRVLSKYGIVPGNMEE